MLLSIVAAPACRTPQTQQGAAPPQEAAQTSSAAEAREPSVRPGINESYEHPDVETFIQRFETESREIYRERERIADAVDLRPGMAVADVGAGTGLFTEPFARRVGPMGTVYAVDIAQEFLDLIERRAAEGGLGNVRTVLCPQDSVNLPENSVDRVFICDTYHHFEYPRSTMSSIYAALRPGGKCIIVDFKREPGVSRQWVLDHVRTGRSEVIEEVTAIGFRLADEQPDAEFLEENYVLALVK
ncbi:MAG: class I SAM-dependent methyltransferase [Phycisphaerales bacterium]|nr:MAG: class I SAM-dependent methyltransferase [Phycisphaerales bacterium]